MRPLLALAWLGALGCAATPYDSYRAKNPDWYGEFPTQGASLHETLAGIYAPPRGDWQRLVHKLTVLRLDGESAALLPRAELDAVLAEDRSGDYAVVAALGCQSEYAARRYGGEKVAWYLFAGNRLVAYDSIDFAERCVVLSEFVPATRERAGQERAVVAFRDAHFPRSMEHVIEFYRKGLLYLGVGRTEDARAMLARGDAAFDVGQRGEQRVDFEGPSRKTPFAGKSDTEEARERLVRALAGADGAPAP